MDFPRGVGAPLFSPAVGATARILSSSFLTHSQCSWIYSTHDLGKEAKARPRLSWWGQKYGSATRNHCLWSLEGCEEATVARSVTLFLEGTVKGSRGS